MTEATFSHATVAASQALKKHIKGVQIGFSWVRVHVSRLHLLKIKVFPSTYVH